MKSIFCAIALAVPMISASQSLPASKQLDLVVNRAIAEGRTPGAVLIVGHRGQIVYRKAFGKRSETPDQEDMTIETIFDIASLTKVVATVPCLMKLYDEGKFKLDDLVTKYVPEFQGRNSSITIRELLTHFSGLGPDLMQSPPWHGYKTAIKMACVDPPEASAGKTHIYSDINFILLGELIRRLSGEMEDIYAKKHIFAPLHLTRTTYKPDARLRYLIAPTEMDPATGLPFCGIVHDPTARAMGGVAGHAGVFSTADDLARYAQMWLNEGELDGVRVFKPETCKLFASVQTPRGQEVKRGLGWDIDSPYSGARGELFPIGSYGHTGFTGTSMWIDPGSKTFVVLLTNAVHPHIRKHSILPLRAEVATIVAKAVGY